MSQKPRSGVPARAAPVSKARAKEAAKEVVVKADPADTQPVAEVQSVTPDPVGPDPEQCQAVAEPELPKVEPVDAGTAQAAPLNIEPVNVQSVAEQEQVKMTSSVGSEPTATATPATEERSVTNEVPSAAAVAALEVAAEPATGPSDTVNETVTAALPRAITATITATADTIAAVTAETVDTASSIEPTKPTLTAGIKSMMKSTEDFVAFGQANLEAFVKSGQIWSAGMQELTKQIATSAKASFDESVSTFKAISTAKSVKEAMDLQSNFAKAAIEKAMAESNKLTDASIKLTEQTLAPITARVTVAVETFGKAA
jgi:phasin family protein